MFGKTELKVGKARDGRHCDLCGCTFPAVRCDKCGSQVFCLSCDDMYHRHPKRRFHLRKAVDPTPTPQARPVLPMKVSSLTLSPGDPSKMPLPPPRKKKPGKSIFDSFRRGSPTESNPNLPRKEYSWSDRLGSITKFMSNRPLPPVPDVATEDTNNTVVAETKPVATHNLAFIHRKVDEKPPALPQRQPRSPCNEPLMDAQQNGDSHNLNAMNGNAVHNFGGPMDQQMWHSYQQQQNFPNQTDVLGFGTIRRQSQPERRIDSPSSKPGGMHPSSSASDLTALPDMTAMPPYPYHHPMAPPFAYPPVYPQYMPYPQYFGNSWANLASPVPTTTDADVSDQSEVSSRRSNRNKYRSHVEKKAKRSQSVLVDRMGYPTGHFYPYGPFPAGYPPWMGGLPEGPPSLSLSLRSLSRLSNQKTKDSDDEDDYSSSPISRPKSSSSEVSKNRTVQAKMKSCPSSSSSDREEVKPKAKTKASPATERRHLKKKSSRKLSQEIKNNQEDNNVRVNDSYRDAASNSRTNDVESPQKRPITDQLKSINDSNLQSNKESPNDFQKMENVPWQCKHCTFLNSPDGRICQVCCKTKSDSPVTQENNQNSLHVGTEQSSSRNSDRDRQDMDNLNSALDEAERQISQSLVELLKVKEETIPSVKETGSGPSKIENWGPQSIANETPMKYTPAPMPLPSNADRSKSSASNNESKGNIYYIGLDREVTIPVEDTNRKDSFCQTYQDVPQEFVPQRSGLFQGNHLPPSSGQRLFERQSPNVPYNAFQSSLQEPRFNNNSNGMYRGHSMASLLPGRHNELPPSNYDLGNMGMGFGSSSIHRSLSRASLLGEMDTWSPDYAVRSKPDFYLSMEELVERRRQETMRAQGLELVRMIREAEQQGFTADDIQVALNNCGKQNPVHWLQENWQNVIRTVVTLATNYGKDKRDNDVGALSENEARNALRLHKGNIWAAVTECVEGRQRKLLELSARGNFTFKEIVDSLTMSEGDVEVAYAKLTNATAKPFLMRIWGSGEGVPNLEGVSPVEFQQPNEFREPKVRDEMSDNELWEDGYGNELEWDEDDNSNEEQDFSPDMASVKSEELEKSEKYHTLTRDNNCDTVISSDRSDYSDAFGADMGERYLSSTSIDEIYLINEEVNEEDLGMKSLNVPKKKTPGFLSKLAALRKNSAEKKESVVNDRLTSEIESESKTDSVMSKSFAPLSILKQTFTALKDTVSGSVSKADRNSNTICEKRTFVVPEVSTSLQNSSQLSLKQNIESDISDQRTAQYSQMTDSVKKHLKNNIMNHKQSVSNEEHQKCSTISSPQNSANVSTLDMIPHQSINEKQYPQEAVQLNKRELAYPTVIDDVVNAKKQESRTIISSNDTISSSEIKADSINATSQSLETELQSIHINDKNIRVTSHNERSLPQSVEKSDIKKPIFEITPQSIEVTPLSCEMVTLAANEIPPVAVIIDKGSDPISGESNSIVTETEITSTKYDDIKDNYAEANNKSIKMEIIENTAIENVSIKNEGNPTNSKLVSNDNSKDFTIAKNILIDSSEKNITCEANVIKNNISEQNVKSPNKFEDTSCVSKHETNKDCDDKIISSTTVLNKTLNLNEESSVNVKISSNIKNAVEEFKDFANNAIATNVISESINNFENQSPDVEIVSTNSNKEINNVANKDIEHGNTEQFLLVDNTEVLIKPESIKSNAEILRFSDTVTESFDVIPESIDETPKSIITTLESISALTESIDTTLESISATPESIEAVPQSINATSESVDSKPEIIDVASESINATVQSTGTSQSSDTPSQLTDKSMQSCSSPKTEEKPTKSEFIVEETVSVITPLVENTNIDSDIKINDKQSLQDQTKQQNESNVTKTSKVSQKTKKLTKTSKLKQLKSTEFPSESHITNDHIIENSLKEKHDVEAVSSWNQIDDIKHVTDNETSMIQGNSIIKRIESQEETTVINSSIIEPKTEKSSRDATQSPQKAGVNNSSDSLSSSNIQDNTNEGTQIEEFVISLQESDNSFKSESINVVKTDQNINESNLILSVISQQNLKDLASTSNSNESESYISIAPSMNEESVSSSSKESISNIDAITPSAVNTDSVISDNKEPGAGAVVNVIENNSRVTANTEIQVESTTKIIANRPDDFSNKINAEAKAQEITITSDTINTRAAIGEEKNQTKFLETPTSKDSDSIKVISNKTKPLDEFPESSSSVEKNSTPVLQKTSSSSLDSSKRTGTLKKLSSLKEMANLNITHDFVTEQRPPSSTSDTKISDNSIEIAAITSVTNATSSLTTKATGNSLTNASGSSTTNASGSSTTNATGSSTTNVTGSFLTNEGKPEFLPSTATTIFEGKFPVISEQTTESFVSFAAQTVEENNEIIPAVKEEVNVTEEIISNEERRVNDDEIFEIESMDEFSSMKKDESESDEDEDTSLRSVSPVRPIGHLRRMSFNTRKEAIFQERNKESWFLPKKIELYKPAMPKRTIKQQLEFERKVRKLVSDKKIRTYRKAEIVAQLEELNFDETEAIYAANECSNLELAISFLQQECQLCTGKYPIGEMISMTHCSHKACKECIRAYFTIQIRDRTIMELLCPFCNEPDITDEDVAQDYFNHLDIMLKKLVEFNIHELFQRKLRDRVLMKDPNFRWCSQCSSGFIADPYLKRLICPDCKAITCASCRRVWEREHEGVSCEVFMAWKDAQDPETQTAGLAKLLTEEGIDCPSCHFRYALAKGGCMHFKCIQCQHDFCSGCSKPFKMGKKCGASEFCAKLGLHAHHPRNCLFYLRDKEPEDLQKLLDMNDVAYNRDSQRFTDEQRLCDVLEQKETSQGLVDDICGKDVEYGFAGLCRVHYVEYLGQLVNRHKVDPIQIFGNDDLELVLKRASIRLPPKKYRESLEEYREKLVQLIQEELPLGKNEVS